MQSDYKKKFLFRDDYKKCSESEEYPLNLIIILGLPQAHLKKYYFESIEEIEDANKNFIQWVNQKVN